jgi:hypothetical protein
MVLIKNVKHAILLLSYIVCSWGHTPRRQLWSCASDSAPSEARKRGSEGGSPRKYDDDSLTGPSDLEVQSRQHNSPY